MKKATHGLSFKNARVLVVGDVMLDRYFFGEVSRISPEAPVPIVKVTRTSSGLGGAANVAANVAGLGGRVTLVGIAGKDDEGRELAALARRNGIAATLVPNGTPTTTKSRIVGAHQQMLRLDLEESRAPSRQALAALKKSINTGIAKAGAVVVSDYAKGVCSEELCAYVIRKANARGIPVIVDPKSEDWSRYARATCVTPNHKEFCGALGRTLPNEDSVIAENSRKLMRKYRLKHLMVTRSEKGMTLVSPRRAVHIHARAQEVYDVSGAGDTVVGTFATALASGLDFKIALDLANIAAGIVVGKLGTVPVAISELEKLVGEQGIFGDQE